MNMASKNYGVRYLRSRELIETSGQEMVAPHLDKGQCYGLTDVASKVWRLLVRPK
jgi:hypothetical protein